MEVKGEIMSAKICPFLWFDDNAEEAVVFYTGIFKNSRIFGISRYPDEGPGVPGKAMTVEFELEGLRYIALNGGPVFKFNEAVSFSVSCENQAEVDYYWEKLTAGGEEGQCGWLKDKYGLSWQIVPVALGQLLGSGDKEQAGKVMKAMLAMKKIDIPTLIAAKNT